MMKHTWSSIKYGLTSAVTAAVCIGMFGTTAVLAEDYADETVIELSDTTILVDGETISEDSTAAVYAGAEIVYYEEGQDSTYGAGDSNDEHSAEEAAENTVITITQAGVYRVTGSLAKGQIAVDLGDDAEDDAEAKVTLILDNADITCTVAPAIVVYEAYECGSDDTESATSEVDTADAGFTLVLADGSENALNGSHVAKIYKEGTTQEEVDSGEAKKAWKMDATLESYVSFNIDAEEEGTGSLTITADNEGIESALHLTINGGNITINSSDDAINASEDYVSVLTVNGGTIFCNAGLGEEGDGIDSNGWIVINDGYVISAANGSSQDSGVDSDMGILLNGGTVLASGNMYDEISEESDQTYLVLNFASAQEAGEILMLMDADGNAVTAFSAENAFTTMVFSSNTLADGDYTLYTVSSVTGTLNGGIYTDITDYTDAVQLAYSSTAVNGGPGGGMGGMGRGQMPDMQNGGAMPEPESGDISEMPDGAQDGQMPEMPDGAQDGQMPQMPDGAQDGQMPEMPDGAQDGQMPEMPDGAQDGQMQQTTSGESQSVFTVQAGANTFSQITVLQDEAAEAEDAEVADAAVDAGVETA